MMQEPPSGGAAEQGDNEADVQREATVRLLDEGEAEQVDVLRVPEYGEFYGQIIEIEEMQESGKRVDSYGVVFDCISKPWFDSLADDLSDAPPMNQIARVANTCVIELRIMRDDMNAMSNELEADQVLADLENVHLSQGWWLLLWLSNTSGYQVQAYLPQDDDPSSVFQAEEPTLVNLQRVFRIRPPSTLMKLHRLAARS